MPRQSLQIHEAARCIEDTLCTVGQNSVLLCSFFSKTSICVSCYDLLLRMCAFLAGSPLEKIFNHKGRHRETNKQTNELID